MEFRLLGPLEVHRGGTPVAIGAPKLRALLVLLLLETGRTVPADRLVADLWGEQPPPQPLVSLRSYVSNLRRLLQEPGAPPVIVTGGRGYGLTIAPDAIDLHRFERLARQGRDAVARGAARAGLLALDEALAAWRGEALADVATEPYAQPVVAKLDELRLTATEDRVEVLLALGQHLEVIPELEAHVGHHRLRERPRRQLMLALHRAGRSPEALQVAAGFRAELAEELGLDPSQELRELVDRILRQDRGLTPATSDESSSVSGESSSTPGPAVTSSTSVDGGPPASPPPTSSVPPVDTGTPVDTAAVDAGAATVPGAALFGRRSERRALRAALDAARVGRGGTTLLAGEPGIGKTSLLRELATAARVAGVPVAFGRCLDAEGVPAFWPWVEVLRQLAADLDGAALRAALADAAAPITQLVPELAARAGSEPAGLGADPGLARFTLYEAVATFLDRLAARADGGGLVVVVDDLHWADLPSLQLLTFLAARAAPAGVCLAGAYRRAAADRTAELDAALAELAREPSSTTLELGALGLEDVAAIASDVAGSAPDPTLVDELVRRGGGNPFFTRQLAAFALEHDDDDLRGAVPVGVRHVLLRRLQLVPVGTRRVLEAAAVLGQDVDARLLARVTGMDVLDVLDHLDVAIEHALVEVTGHAGGAGAQAGGAYRFVHALVRETLDEELTPGRAARLHAAAATALEAAGQPPAATVAQHLWLAADVVDVARVIAWLRTAADEALAVYAWEQAEQHLRRALHLLSHAGNDDPGLELAVRLRLVDVLTRGRGWVANDIDELVGSRLRELDGQVGLDLDVLALWWSLWTNVTTRGQLDASIELVTELLARAEVPGADPAVRVAAHLAAAYTRLFRGEDPALVREHLRRGRQAEAEAGPVDLAITPEHLSVSLGVACSIAHGLYGEVAAAEAAVADLIAQARTVGTPFSLGYALLFAAWTCATIDRPELVRAQLDECLALCERTGLHFLATLVTPLHGWALARTGADPAVQAPRMAEACEQLLVAGQRHATTCWRLLLAEVHLLAGDRAEAEAELARARALGTAIGEHAYGRLFAAFAPRVTADA